MRNYASHAVPAKPESVFPEPVLSAPADTVSGDDGAVHIIEIQSVNPSFHADEIGTVVPDVATSQTPAFHVCI